MKETKENIAVPVITVFVAWLWLPALSSVFFYSLTWLRSGLSEIPTWVLFLAVSSLSITVACYLHCRKNRIDSGFLSLPLKLFLASVFLIPFYRGYTKALTEPLQGEKPDVNPDVFIQRMTATLDTVAHTLLVSAPVLASLLAIGIVLSHYWPNLRNKKPG